MATLHTSVRWAKKKEIESNSEFKAGRWVVEVANLWLNRFRKLLVRYEKEAKNYLSLLYFAHALTV